MTDQQFNNDRRRLLRGALLGIAAAPLAYVSVRGSNVLAQEMPELDENDPQAIALNYVHDAADRDEMRTEGAICGNCRLYLENDTPNWGGCTAFPGKLVADGGWCSAWVPMPS
ncbi:High potential iron-sulfur protein [Spiribacter sp. C176]|uniref:High-potential iron-sulfur protein n=1 Tax=Spiribacter salilacus TaxID=2664894 RepID=A0A6N7R1D8_9GAMM|nr:high-potential iron-sulfur protein [Spiribacter salilacus]MRH78804.1 High potential iron-sulfur protein [Spiribacter salilacus]